MIAQIAITRVKETEVEMFISINGWIAAGEDRVYDKHWNLITDAVSYNPESGDVRRKTTGHDGFEDSSIEGVATTRYLTPLHVLPKA